MNRRLALLRWSLIPRVKLRMLNDLAEVTAAGFDVAAPRWAGRSFRVWPTEYAQFTAREAGRLAALGNESATKATKERLRSGAEALGSSLRKRLRIRDSEESFEAMKVLYRHIGIEIHGGPSGGVTVSRCFFADFYSGQVCRIIESLDQGLVAGLFAGATFEFSERLTEGGQRCRACLSLAGTGA